MKYYLLILSIICSSVIYAQTDCRPYVPVTKGTKWEHTNYSAKGKVTGKTGFELLDVTETEEGVTFTIKATSYDKKGEEIFSNQYNAYCKNGKFQLDMAFKINGEAMQAYQNMEVDLDASEFEIPDLDAAAGTTLEDGSLTMSIGASSFSMLKLTVLVTDRKVEARESYTTPVGTFDCIKLSQKVSTKIGIKVEASSREWYAEEVGLVRSESYDKKGKLTGYSELTMLDRK